MHSTILWHCPSILSYVHVCTLCIVASIAEVSTSLHMGTCCTYVCTYIQYVHWKWQGQTVQKAFTAGESRNTHTICDMDNLNFCIHGEWPVHKVYNSIHSWRDYTYIHGEWWCVCCTYIRTYVVASIAGVSTYMGTCCVYIQYIHGEGPVHVQQPP